MDLHELDPVAAPQVDGQNVAKTGGIILVLKSVWLQRSSLLGFKTVMELPCRDVDSRFETDNQGVIFGGSEGKFLPIEIAGDGVPLHNNTGFVIIHTGGEGACQCRGTSIFKFGCIFAKVPNVALSVL